MKRYKHTFTLIELLVVISIISLLISILLPALGAARKAAKNMQCLSLMRQYATANFVYAGDHNGWYVPMRNATASEQTTWQKVEYFQDLLNARPTPSGTSNYWLAGRICPEATLSHATLTASGFMDLDLSYGANSSWKIDSGSNWDYPDYRVVNGQSYRVITQSDMDQLNVGNKVMYSDAIDWQINGNRVNKWLGNDALTLASGFNGCMSFRHKSGRVMNASFYDGHAQGVREEEALDNEEMWILRPDLNE